MRKEEHAASKLQALLSSNGNNDRQANPRLKYANARRNNNNTQRHTTEVFLSKVEMSAAQYRIQGSVALHLGAKTKIRAIVAVKEKNGARSVQACSTSNSEGPVSCKKHRKNFEKC